MDLLGVLLIFVCLTSCSTADAINLQDQFQQLDQNFVDKIIRLSLAKDYVVYEI